MSPGIDVIEELKLLDERKKIQGRKRHLLADTSGLLRPVAWLMNFRRHARDYEVLTHHSEAFIQIAMIHLLIKRIK